jgi:hypothetical protein
MPKKIGTVPFLYYNYTNLECKNENWQTENDNLTNTTW